MPLSYRQFAELADLHRHLIGIVDQKVGTEKAVIRKYVAALAGKLASHPERRAFFARWRSESGMGNGEVKPAAKRGHARNQPAVPKDSSLISRT